MNSISIKGDATKNSSRLNSGFGGAANALPHMTEILVGLTLSVLLVVLIQLLTNEIDIQRYDWDFKKYIDLAENGFKGHLVAPFAYRYATPFVAGFLSNQFNLSVHDAFRLIAYIGVTLQLFGIFLFSRWFGFKLRSSITAMAFVSISMFNVKFLLFDVYRPDPLAYVFVLLGVFAFLTNRLVLLSFITAIGLQIREFAIIPAAICLSHLFLRRKTVVEPFASKTDWTLLAVTVTAAVLLPRLLIPTTRTLQAVDPINDLSTLKEFFMMPLHVKRDVNFVFSLLGFTLPVLMLLSKDRLQKCWEDLILWQRFILSYVAVTLILSFYGGTDVMRFATYLFVPQTLILCAILERDVHWLEITLALAATVFFNRLLLHIPMDSENSYLDFYAGWDSRVNLATLSRFAELFAFVALGQGLRVALHLGGKRGAGVGALRL